MSVGGHRTRPGQTRCALSKWAGKYVIGLTGNIGTGKSVVRKMLEHLGAYGIDADALSHRAIAKGAPGYAAVLANFGRWVLGPDDQIDRAKLGRIVFSDPQALKTLEDIIHPLVGQAVDLLVRRSSQPVVVIEAIKLLEGNLRPACDSIWVTATSPDVQLARLMRARGMSEADARQRITAQPPQQAKIDAANVVIRNDATFEETWKQVTTAWAKVVPPALQNTAAAPASAKPAAGAPAVQWVVERGRPRHSAEIAALINHIQKRTPGLSASDIMAAFGEKAFLLLRSAGKPLGVIGWQVENLVSRTTDILLDAQTPAAEALPALIQEMEKSSRDLQCEAALVFAPPELARLEPVWKALGYENRTAQSLSVQAWQEAALDSMPAGSVLFFKQLRKDRILRPI